MADPMAAVTDLVFVALVGIMDPLRAEAKDAVHVALNIGLVMRRERQAPWASPVFPYLGWIILGWVLTWAAVELQPLQRLLDTTSLSGGQWGTVIGLSPIAPAVVGIDKAIQLSRQRNPASVPMWSSHPSRLRDWVRNEDRQKREEYPGKD